MKYIKSKGGYYYKVYKNGKKKRISKKDFLKQKMKGGGDSRARGCMSSTIKATERCIQRVNDSRAGRCLNCATCGRCGSCVTDFLYRNVSAQDLRYNSENAPNVSAQDLSAQDLRHNNKNDLTSDSDFNNVLEREPPAKDVQKTIKKAKAMLREGKEQRIQDMSQESTIPIQGINQPAYHKNKHTPVFWGDMTVSELYLKLVEPPKNFSNDIDIQKGIINFFKPGTEITVDRRQKTKNIVRKKLIEILKEQIDSYEQ